MKKLLLFILLAFPVTAARFFDVFSAQFAVCSIDPISPPLTIAAWACPWTYSNCVSIAINTTTNADERVQLTWLFTPAAGFNEITAAGASVGGTVNWSYPTATPWSHSVGVFASSTSRSLYTNGVLALTDTTSAAVNGLNQVVIGARKNSAGYGAFMWGRIAEAAVWDVALTAGEILSLSQGVAPFMIRPTNLKFYAPLTGRETASEWNLAGAAVSLTNAPTASALHPRIYRQ